MLYYNYLFNCPSVLLPPTHWAEPPGAAIGSSWTLIPSTWQRAWHFCALDFMNE